MTGPNLDQQNPIRSISYALLSWIIIFSAIAVSVAGPLWFYPFAVLLIANRQLALSFLAHEGVHGNISSGQSVNDIWARYFCAFPLFISLSRYRLLHLMHHRFLGTRSDPDIQFYGFYPQSGFKLFWTFTTSWLSFGTALTYFNYFNDVLGFARGRVMSRLYPQAIKWQVPKELRQLDDRWPFIFFWTLALATIILSQSFLLFAMYWLLPLYCYVFYFRLTAGLQHGRIHSDQDPQRRSRSIAGSAFVMELLLPGHINFHEEHHDNPKVPSFNLRKLHALKSRSSMGYFEALRTLVKT